MKTNRFLKLVLPLALITAIASVAPAADILIPQGANWKYLDDGSDQGTAWREAAFDDSSWAQGLAELGYGDGTEATVVNSGPSSDKFITTYFRHAFNVSNPSAYVGLFLQVLRDDGVVVYLNGVEVFRNNLPGGTIAYNTYASSALGGVDETTFVDQPIGTGNLVTGENVMAVEIHQANATSSDISFDLQLTGTDSTLITRGPYLQQATPTSLIIRWRTALDGQSWVRYGTDPGNLSQLASDSSHTSEHIVTLSGLQPNTLYYYELGDGSGWAERQTDDYFVTPPLVGTAQPTRIWVIGDSGTKNIDAWNVQDAYLDLAATQPADLWLMLGDNAYDTGTDTDFQSAVFNMYTNILPNTPLWSTRGNHESDVNGSGSTYYNIFTLPTGGEAGGLASGTEAYYSFDYGNIHFICLDSQGSSRASGGAMATWLQNDLAATLQDWVIAFWHHPPYTKGSHNSDTEGQLVDMRQNFLPILEGAGVDLVLCGHSHSYERSYLLDGHYGSSDTLTPGMKLDGGSGREDGTGPYEKATLGAAPHEGAVYIVAGSSGKISGGSLNHPAMFVSINELGSVILDVDGNRLDARFLRETGAIDDYFTIIKGSSTPTSPQPPGNLQAAAGNAQVVLNWETSSNADHYNVQRAESSGGPYTVIALQVGTASYTDNTVINDTTYYYVVTAENEVGESLPSNEASATPTSVALATALSEIAVAGTVGGDFNDTASTDGNYEQIQERESGGRPSSRYSFLEHKWLFNVAGGNTVTFYVEAFLTSNNEADNFIFSYSEDDSAYTDMVTVSKTGDDNMYQSFALPASLSGTVYIRVTDTDQSQGNNGLDSLFVDHMYILSDNSQGGTPPSAPVMLTADPGDQSVTLSWSASAGASSYIVRRGEAEGGPYEDIVASLGVTTYHDSDLVNGTTYYYVVAAVNSSGTSPDSPEASATPEVPSIPNPPTSLTASQAGKRKISLNWTQSNSPGIVQNTISRGTTPSGPFVFVADIPAGTTFQDGGLNSGTTYHYQVTATSSEGESNPSNVASETAK